jgi:hypothetical protein
MRAKLLFATGLLLAATQAGSPRPIRLELLDTAVIASPRLTESSGVVTSRRRAGVYWTHNDSGDGPRLYATDSLGTDLGSLQVEPAGAVDWEDIAAGSCVVAPGWCLYAGDIGDNNRRRPFIVVYRLREPAPPEGPSDTLRTAPLLDSIVLRYPDHPHDAEALAVTREGELLIITKDREPGPILYRGPLDRARVVLERVAILPLSTDPLRGRLVTGADISPDGRILVLRTYSTLHFFELGAAASPAMLTPPEGLPIPVVESQGEAVAFDRPSRLVLTSERGIHDHAILTRLTVRGLER